MSLAASVAAQDTFPDVPENHWAYEARSHWTGQFPDGQSTPNTDYMPILFLNPKVVSDMHLSPAVASKEQSLIIQMGMQMLPAVQGMRKQGGGSNSAAMNTAIKAFEELERKSLEPLTPVQRTRYRQLSLQFYGPAALAMPKVASQVGLNPAQRAKVDTLISAGGRQMLGQVPYGSAQNMMSQMPKIRKSANQARASLERQVDAILTPSQRAKWRAMQGPALPGISDMGGLGSIFGG